jgi:hypothetical protein
VERGRISIRLLQHRSWWKEASFDEETFSLDLRVRFVAAVSSVISRRQAAERIRVRPMQLLYASPASPKHASPHSSPDWSVRTLQPAPSGKLRRSPISVTAIAAAELDAVQPGAKGHVQNTKKSDGTIINRITLQ